MRVRVLLIAVLLLALSGCKVDTNVALDVNSNGSGDLTVELRMDQQAADVIGDVKTDLYIQDLEKAGWDVSDPKKQDNQVLITARHGFANPSEANALVSQLGGPFRDFDIRQQRSLTSVQTEFVGTVDLSRGIQSWGTEQLQGRTGSSLGVDPSEIQSNLGVNLEDAFTLSVAVNMPGQRIETSPQMNDDGHWTVPYGVVSQLSAKAEGTNWMSVRMFILAGAFLIAALVTAAIWQTYKPKHRVPRADT